MDPRVRLLLCLYCSGSWGCLEDEPSKPPTVEPDYGDPCRYVTCSGKGICRNEDGWPICACDVGYGGDDCAGCEPGFHLDWQRRCVSDVSCAEQPRNPCGSHGSCEDESGVIECACDQGYEGPRCTLCASGYGRSVDDECLLLVLGGGGGGVSQIPPGDRPDAGRPPPTHEPPSDDEPSEDPPNEPPDAGPPTPPPPPPPPDVDAGRPDPPDDPCSADPDDREPRTVSFDDLTGFPSPSDNCLTPVPFTLSEVTLESISGDGDVWACSPSTFYGLATQHVLLEAGSLGPAAISFSGAIDSLSFDYGAKTALGLELLADGIAVQTLSAARWSSGTVSLTFATPITKLELRSMSGFTNRIGIDNLVHPPPDCE